MTYVRRQADLPGVCCRQCRENYLEDGIEADCFTGSCPVGFDTLQARDLEILDARALIVSLSELGLAERVCREFDLDLDDLRLIAAVEEELGRLNQKSGEGNGRR